ncbi:MAG TPA: outer membrane protein assembly factor BamD [Gammaproteobacteria bacterium]|nr:outer membrane protein assembly factor BamD [Gammaproteobacteria bacterium]
MRLLKLTVILAFLLAATGCSLLPEQIDTTKNWSAERLYSEAKDSLNSGDYTNAIKYFETLEARYPFGRYAQQAQLEIIYAYYKDQEPASAVAAADRFIKMHPRHPYVDYAYYLKGLANYNQGRGIVERYLPQDPSQRDPGAARQSFQDFSDLVKRFPESKYAKDAAQRMAFLRNNLAQYEINVAAYYMKREAFVAAANRAKYVVENYPRTPAVPDALGIMAKAYKIMGLNDLSADALRVLKLNHPDHPAIAEVENLTLK